ncbi:MAG: HAMP domain-containing sensor histidine kinase [Bacteroidota bacterium]
MKLLQRTSRYYFFASTIIFFLAVGALGAIIPRLTDLETDELLWDYKQVLLMQLSEMDTIPSEIIILDNIIELQPVSIDPEAFKPQFKDTLRLNIQDDEFEPFRKFTFYEHIQGQPYQITINHSKLDYEELMTTLGTAILIILVLILAGINLLNTFLSHRLWKPFYQIIRDIEGFNFEKNQPITPSKTSIEEFQILHQAINQMTHKARGDYHSLKQFSENASHEIQNPLAIIRSNIELLIQKENREPKEWAAIKQIHEAASRISKLNGVLILLTRIENRQFTDKQKLNFEDLIKEKIDQFDPLFKARDIQVYMDLVKSSHYMDPTLSNVLLNNLISNAIKHNLDRGEIIIILRQSHLIIENTGKPLNKDFSTLLERFSKESEASTSLGLGLSIVKEICDIYQLRIKYQYENGKHQISIIF